MPRLLVISHACITEPHRRPYGLLATDAGWSVDIVAPESIRIDDTLQKSCDPAPPGAQYRLWPLPLRLLKTGRFAHFMGLSGVMRKARPDIVFAEADPGSFMILQAHLAAPRTPIVAYAVDNIRVDRIGSARQKLLRLDARGAARDATVAGLIAIGSRLTAAIACLNDDALRIYRQQWRFPRPMRLVPIGTDLGLFRVGNASELRTSLGLEGAFVVGYFGRLVPEKGVHVLIEALSRLPANVHLLLDAFPNFAPGSYLAELLALGERLGVRDRVVTFNAPHGAVAEYMRCCDAIALPSLETPRFKEQFGRVLPEAMASGVPTIASRAGYLPAIVGDAGLLVAPGSVDALVAAIRSLTDDPALRKRLSAAGLQRVRDLWSIEVQVRELKALIEPLLQSKAANGASSMASPRLLEEPDFSGDISGVQPHTRWCRNC